jgi:glycine/D-amino acid oxidase-like deaminating enzyme
VLFAGVEAKTQPERVREKMLVQRAGQLMYELSLHYPSISGLKAEWAWSLPVVSTLDGLPWVGLHRNYPFHFFGIALGWHGDSISWFTARAAARHFTNETRTGDDAFTFLRAL